MTEAGSCLCCLGPLRGGEEHELHSRCARRVFGTSTRPEILVDPSTLYLFGQEMAGRVSISGVQQKLSLGWSKLTLQVTAEHSAFILKLSGQDYPELAANEHLSLHLARLVGLEVPECTLVRFDAELALIVRRFDRTGDGGRIAMEDFCQLNGLLAADKYSGSAELCARAVRRFADEPGPDLLRLFRMFLFSWWIGNGDLHLKNLSLFSREPGRPRLAPAYDLLSTRVVIPGDPLALSVGGRAARLDRRTWVDFAEYCGIPEKMANREIGKLAGHLERAGELVGRSLLSGVLQDRYLRVLKERSRALMSE